jgi:ADP-ribosylglycohydrolase
MLRNFEHKSYDDISTSGYVLDTLEAVLWAFFKTESFEEGLVLLVNMGDDADTVGAVFGTLAGAHYGVDNIPAKWLQALQQHAMVCAVFDELWTAAVQCWQGK